MISIRSVVTGLAVAFTGFLVARASLVTDDLVWPPMFWGALVAYLLVAWLCVFWGPPRRRAPAIAAEAEVLPVWVSVIAVLTAAAVPPVVSIAVGPDGLRAQYATWYIGGIGALMTILVVRRASRAAWLGTVVLIGWAFAWLGPADALRLGLVGSIVWVLGAQVFIYALRRAARDTERLGELQRRASALQAAQSGRQRERRVQVQRALAVAGPVLVTTIAAGGDLGPEERTEARIAEGRLRDELRGPRLLDDDVRAALDAARRRGALVTVLDEGGLAGLTPEQLSVVRADLAATVRRARSERLYIRTSPDSRVAVTVVGRSSPTPELSDGDSVDLWREIEIPAAGEPGGS